jgi:hypothetical protein
LNIYVKAWSANLSFLVRGEEGRREKKRGEEGRGGCDRR